MLIDHLIDEEIIPEDKVYATSIHTTDENTLELRRLELQGREKERESQLKLKELEIREKELSIQLRLKELEIPTSSTSKLPSESQFDISKQIRFIPPFQEKEVDKYFLHFEKVATSLEWPKDVWTLLLQSVLVGKAREVYSSVSRTKCTV